MDCESMMHMIVIIVGVYCNDNRAYFAPGYIGCFKDNTTRILSRQLENRNNNTGIECRQRCKQEGYRYAGTEARRECFCSHILNGVKTPNEDCNRACTGNRTEHCGGIWHIAVYDNDAYKMAMSPGYIGCYKDINVTSGTQQRTLPYEILKISDNKGQICKKECMVHGYKFAGTEYGTECFCGNTRPQNKVLDSECYYTCPGDRNEYCGGDWRLSVYDTIARTISKSLSTTPMSLVSDSTQFRETLINRSSPTTDNHLTPGSSVFISAFKSTSTSSLALTSSKFWKNEQTITPLLLTQQRSITNGTSTFSSANTEISYSRRVNTSSSFSVTTHDKTLPALLAMHEKKDSTVVAQNISNNDWVEINGKQLLVVEREVNFSNARNTCIDMDAELLAYSNPTRYFQPSIRKILGNKSYWLGVNNDIVDKECPILFNRNNFSSFRLVNCDNTNQFICSKSNNITANTHDVEFKELLKDLSVNVIETSKAKRKLMSATDTRRSSQSIGACVIFVICIFIAFYVFIDINWKNCHCVGR